MLIKNELTPSSCFAIKPRGEKLKAVTEQKLRCQKVQMQYLKQQVLTHSNIYETSSQEIKI